MADVFISLTIADYEVAAALGRPRLTVQEYAHAWRVPASIVASYGPYNPAGYNAVLAETRRKFELFGAPITNELAWQCKAYVDAMKRNKRRK